MLLLASGMDTHAHTNMHTDVMDKSNLKKPGKLDAGQV